MALACRRLPRCDFGGSRWNCWRFRAWRNGRADRRGAFGQLYREGQSSPWTSRWPGFSLEFPDCTAGSEMSVLRVTCITRSESDPDARIRAIGGDDFHHTVEEAVQAINSRTHQYWTQVEGESVWVEVAYRPDGEPYLKTGRDESQPNSLLELEECRFAADEGSGSEQSLPGLESGAGGGRDEIPQMAERLALRTIIRMLVLNRYARDEARLERNRDDAVRRVCGAVERMDLDEDTRERLNEAVTRELHFFFAAPPKPQTPS